MNYLSIQRVEVTSTSAEMESAYLSRGAVTGRLTAQRAKTKSDVVSCSFLPRDAHHNAGEKDSSVIRHTQTPLLLNPLPTPNDLGAYGFSTVSTHLYGLATPLHFVLFVCELFFVSSKVLTCSFIES